MTLHEYVKSKGSIAEAARSMGVPYITMFRWYWKKHSPSRAMREKLQSTGILIE